MGFLPVTGGGGGGWAFECIACVTEKRMSIEYASENQEYELQFD